MYGICRISMHSIQGGSRLPSIRYATYKGQIDTIFETKMNPPPPLSGSRDPSNQSSGVFFYTDVVPIMLFVVIKLYLQPPSDCFCSGLYITSFDVFNPSAAVNDPLFHLVFMTVYAHACGSIR